MQPLLPLYRPRAAAVVLVLLAVAAVVAPSPAEAKIPCGHVFVYYRLGAVVGAQGYSAYSCGCSLIQWGVTTTEAQFLDNYCPIE
jgi:hypothetical protein